MSHANGDTHLAARLGADAFQSPRPEFPLPLELRVNLVRICREQIAARSVVVVLAITPTEAAYVGRFEGNGLAAGSPTVEVDLGRLPRAPAWVNHPEVQRVYEGILEARRIQLEWFCRQALARLQS